MSFFLIPVDESGLTPHFDPRTQTLTKGSNDGVLCWRISNFRIEDLQGKNGNDDMDWYADFYTAKVNNILSSISDLKANEDVYNSMSADEKAKLSSYEQEVIGILTQEGFPVGVKFPEPFKGL